MHSAPSFFGISKKEISQSMREPLATEGMQCHVRQGSGEILVPMQEYAAAGAGAGYRFFQGIWEQKQVFSVCIPKTE